MRLRLLISLVCSLFFFSLAAQDQPNIVIVFMDNFGWGEVEDYTVIIGGSANLAQNQIDGKDPLNVHIFPNPVKEILVVQPQTNSTGTIFVNIYNVVGRKVGYREIRGEERFDVSTLQPGYYLMEFDNGKEKITKQFIKK